MQKQVRCCSLALFYKKQNHLGWKKAFFCTHQIFLYVHLRSHFASPGQQWAHLTPKTNYLENCWIALYTGKICMYGIHIETHTNTRMPGMSSTVYMSRHQLQKWLERLWWIAAPTASCSFSKHGRTQSAAEVGSISSASTDFRACFAAALEY